MEDLAIFETAVRYQMYHAIGILLIGVASFYLTEKLVSIPAYFLILGIIIFSGSKRWGADKAFRIDHARSLS